MKRQMTMTEMMELFTIEITGAFDAANGELSDEESLGLRKIGEYFIKLSNIADAKADLNDIRRIMNNRF